MPENDGAAADAVDDAGLDDVAAAKAARQAELREIYRKQVTASIGGWSGTIIVGLPTVVFVIVESISGLRPGLYAAIGTAIVLVAYRLARKQPLQQALSGVLGVLIAALIAAHTGQARGYFLYGIWTSFAYAVPWGVSALVRRPLVGLVWEFIDPSPPDPDDPQRKWYRRTRLRRAYSNASLIASGMFLFRGIIQAVLYEEGSTGWLAFAKIATGTPLYLVCLAAGYWIVRRARHEVAVAAGADGEAGADDKAETDGKADTDGAAGADDTAGADSVGDGAADRGLGLG